MIETIVDLEAAVAADEREPAAMARRHESPGTSPAYARAASCGHSCRPCGVIICGRQRARGPGSSRCGPSARKQIARSSPPASVTGISCAVNMLSEERISWPLRKTSADRRQPLETQDRLTGLGVSPKSRDRYQASWSLERLGIVAIKATGASSACGDRARHGRGNELCRRREYRRVSARAGFASRTRFQPSVSRASFRSPDARQSAPAWLKPPAVKAAAA